MSIDDERLMAYADGELGPDERAEIESALSSDAALRERLESHRRTRARIAHAYADTMDEAVPERLLAAARGGPSPRAVEVVDLSAHRARRAIWSAREWGAMAASLVGGVVIGLGAMSAQAPLITVTADGLSARGALERALDRQLGSDEAGAVRIGLSFQSQNGAYCRTFDLVESRAAGIACRGADGWKVAMTQAQDQEGEVRMAGASEAILAAVDAMIEGEPLDAVAEAQARDAGWRTRQP